MFCCGFDENEIFLSNSKIFCWHCCLHQSDFPSKLQLKFCLFISYCYYNVLEYNDLPFFFFLGCYFLPPHKYLRLSSLKKTRIKQNMLNEKYQLTFMNRY